VTAGSQEATGTPRDEDLEAGEAQASAEPAGGPNDTIDDTRFAHHSEAEMARILDFYQVRWEYEPTTFPILWNLDGDVVESFAPDFYLPDLEVYLEMTTLRQRLVRKKNRKLRRLRELYPDIRIKLFYARDFRAMMLKYGRLGLAETLSGTPGQVVPQRGAPAAPAAESAAEEVAPAEAPVAESLIVDEAATTDDVAPRPAPRPRSNRRRRRAGQAARLAAEREARA
jgi:hypoxanthine phosphoribosyltransferase